VDARPLAATGPAASMSMADATSFDNLSASGATIAIRKAPTVDGERLASRSRRIGPRVCRAEKRAAALSA